MLKHLSHRVRNTTASAGLLLGMLVPGSAAYAAMFRVFNTNDSGNGSLRRAIDLANAEPGRDIVRFDPSLEGSSIGLTGGTLFITDALNIRGPGAEQLTVSGNETFPIFDVAPDIRVRMSGLTTTGGHAGPGVSGGGVSNRGSLHISDSTISGNTSDGVGGGVSNEGALILSNASLVGNSAEEGGSAIVSSGSLSVRGSSIDGNQGGYGFGDGSDAAVLLIEGTSSIVNSSVSYNDCRRANYSFCVGGIAQYGGRLDIRSSRIAGNEGVAYGGAYRVGGIWVQGPGALTVVDSAISDNWVGLLYGNGGGIANNGADVIVMNSTISGNYATTGGGIANRGNLLLVNSTVHGNRASAWPSPDRARGGGGVYNAGELTLINSTISGNSCPDVSCSGGGGIRNLGNLHLSSTIVADNDSGNPAPGLDISGTVTTAENSLIEDPNGHNVLDGVDGNIVGVDPLLEPIADNGGLTLTQALGPGSPAIDAGSNPDALLYDQRGEGFAREVGAAADIGAFEVQE